METNTQHMQRLWNEIQKEVGVDGSDYRVVELPDNQRPYGRNPKKELVSLNNDIYVDHNDLELGFVGIFEEFTDEEIKGILAHEAGHIATKDDWTLSRSEGETIADRFAAEHGFARENISTLEKVEKLETSFIRHHPELVPSPRPSAQLPTNRIKFFKNYLAGN